MTQQRNNKRTTEEHKRAQQKNTYKNVIRMFIRMIRRNIVATLSSFNLLLFSFLKFGKENLISRNLIYKAGLTTLKK